MFEREHHRKILTILHSLNQDLLANCGAYFGGGTLVSLRHGEHRLSEDIDFMCSFDEKYTDLREEVRNQGFDAIFSSFDEIVLPREIKVDRYGIRFPIVVAQTSIKFEIVPEGLIKFGSPDYPSWSPVACLSEIDSIAEKLLANTDRWPDRRKKSRDLIDLSVQRLAAPFPEEAIAKAQSVYPAIKHLKKSIQHFQENPDYRQECFEILEVSHPPQIINGIDLLASDLGMEETERMFIESQWDEPKNCNC